MRTTYNNAVTWRSIVPPKLVHTIYLYYLRNTRILYAGPRAYESIILLFTFIVDADSHRWVADKACERPHECDYRGSIIARISSMPRSEVLLSCTIKQTGRVRRGKWRRVHGPYASRHKPRVLEVRKSTGRDMKHTTSISRTETKRGGRLFLSLKALASLPHHSTMAFGMVICRRPSKHTSGWQVTTWNCRKCPWTNSRRDDTMSGHS
jgi:hypothetical protein